MPLRRTLLALLGVVCLVIAAFQVPVASGAGEAASRDIAKAATVVYVSLRAVNAALSVAQEIEMGVSLGGQATTRPMMVLEPVDDTIERIAAVVFTVAATSWLLALAFQPVAVIGFVVAGLGALGLAFLDRWPETGNAARALLHLGLVLALVLPLTLAAGTEIGRIATEGAEARATAELQRVATEARGMIGRDDADGSDDVEIPSGFFAGMFDGAERARDQIRSFANAADYYWSNADTVLDAAFVLIAVFLLRIFVLPGVLLFILLRMARRLL